MTTQSPSSAPTIFQPIPVDTVSSHAAMDSELELGELLDLAIEHEASDIHFGADTKIALRVFGVIHFVDSAGIIDRAQAEKLIFAMFKNEEEKQKFLQSREADFSYLHSDGTAFRCNTFFRRGCISVVMRRIAKSVPTLEQLGLPMAVHGFAKAKQGLVLVCGPTGSGKSTTLCSTLEEINTNRVEHIVTIEDPIEYNFTNKKSIFSQRELGHDTHSFDAALRAAMRQDPDIVMVGELRDRETTAAALNLCETGHLVFSTLHTNSAAKTIGRIVNIFPLDQRTAILTRLADSLVGVLSQRLLPRVGGGRIAVYEVLVNNSAAKNAIRQGDVNQLENIIATSSELGMISIKRSAMNLLEQGLVTQADVEHLLHDD